MALMKRFAKMGSRKWASWAQGSCCLPLFLSCGYTATERGKPRQETAVGMRFLDVRAGSRAREPVDKDGGRSPGNAQEGAAVGDLQRAVGSLLLSLVFSRSSAQRGKERRKDLLGRRKQTSGGGGAAGGRHVVPLKEGKAGEPSVWEGAVVRRVKGPGRGRRWVRPQNAAPAGRG